MYKMLMELDYDKLKDENKYDVEKIEQLLKHELSKRGIDRDEDGFYVGGTFEAYWAFILSFSKEEWFLDNLKVWKWYNSDDSANPEDYGVENILLYYKEKKLKQRVG